MGAHCVARCESAPMALMSHPSGPSEQLTAGKIAPVCKRSTAAPLDDMCLQSLGFKFELLHCTASLGFIFESII
jgi:hypothetical protein